MHTTILGDFKIQISNNLHYSKFLNYTIESHNQSWTVSPIQYLLRQKSSIVDTFVFVFVSIIKIKKVFVIVSISHKWYLRYVSTKKIM